MPAGHAIVRARAAQSSALGNMDMEDVSLCSGGADFIVWSLPRGFDGSVPAEGAKCGQCSLDGPRPLGVTARQPIALPPFGGVATFGPLAMRYRIAGGLSSALNGDCLQ